MSHNPWKIDSEEFQLYETAYWKIKEGFKRKIKFLKPYLKEYGMFAPKGDLNSFNDFFNWLNNRDESIVSETVYDENGQEIGITETRKSDLENWERVELLDGGFLILPRTDISENDILDWIIERANSIKQKLSINGDQPSDEQVKKLENLPHALCLLYDLGIIDLLDERFSNKNYKGKARETDKAKLISIILKIEKVENVRASIRKKDYLSEKATRATIDTLNSLGLEPSKLTD